MPCRFAKPLRPAAAICRLALLLLLLLPGGPQVARATHESPHGPLRIGIFPFAPINDIDAQGNATGLFPALLQKIADQQGWQLRYVPGSFAEGMERLQRHQIDLLLSVARSEERKKLIDYTHESVLELWGQVFVLPEHQGINIAELAGQPVGVMQRDISGQNFRRTAADLGIVPQFREYASFAQVFAAVERGEVVAGVAPQHFGLRHKDEYRLVPSSIQFSPFSIYFAAQKGMHHEFLSTIDAYLFRWKQDRDSYYYQQLSRWLGIGGQRELPQWLLYSLIGTLVLALSFFLFNLLLRQQVQAATAGLKATEVELKAIFDGAPGLMFLVDRERRVVRVNRATLEFTGGPEQEVLGMRGGEMFHCRSAENAVGGCGYGEECESCTVRQLVMETFATRQGKKNQQVSLQLQTAQGLRTVYLLVSTTLLLEDLQPRVLVCAEDVTPMKQAELALGESEERFRALFEQAADAICLFDEQGRMISANPQTSRISGYRLAELQQLRLEDVTPADELERLQKISSQVRRSGQPQRLESRFQTKNGEQLQVEFNLSALRVQGQTLLFASARDIGLRKQIEAALYFIAQKGWEATSESFFPSLARYLGEALQLDYAFVDELLAGGERARTVGLYGEGAILPNFEYDLAGTPCCTVTDKQLCLYNGDVQARFPEDKMLEEMGVTAYCAVPLWDTNGVAVGLIGVMNRLPFSNPKQVGTLLQLVAVRAAHELEQRAYLRRLQEHQEHLEDQVEVRTRELSKAHQLAEAANRKLREHQANLEQLVAARTGELEERNRQLQLNERKYAGLYHQFEGLLDAISDPLALLNAELQPLYCNRAYEQACQQLQLPQGQGLFQLTGKQRQSVVQRCLQQGQVVEDMLTTADQRSWGIKAFPLLDDGGRGRQAIAIAVDITEKLRLRTEANRAGRLASLGELAAGIAHEINNPNAVTLLNLPILRDAFADADPILADYYRQQGALELAGIDYAELQQELPLLIERVQESAVRIKRIVEDLKNFARDDLGPEFEPVDLNRVVEAAVRLLGNSIRKATDRFEQQLPPTLPPARGNFQKLEQVVINLIQNACQALSDRSQAVRVETGVDASGERLFLRVSDQGGGSSRSIWRG